MNENRSTLKNEGVKTLKLFEYPVADTHDNLLRTKSGEVIAFYKIPSISVAVVDGKKKTKVKEDVARMLKKLLPNGHFELALVPKDFRLIEKMRDVATILAPEAKDYGKEVLNKTIHTLNHEMELPYQYEWLIGVTLKKMELALDVKQLARDKISDLSVAVVKLAGYEVKENETWYEDYTHEAAEMNQLLAPLRARPLSDVELFYDQRHQFLRYTPHEQDEVVANRDGLNVTDTLINVDVREGLKLTTPYGESYVCVLPIGKLPTLLNQQHLAECIHQFNFPVELRIKASFATINGPTGIKSVMHRSKIRVSKILKEAHHTGSIQHDRIVEGKIALDDLDKKLGNKEPIIDYSMSLIVSASSCEQLRRRKKAVLSAFKNLQVKVSTATFDQAFLFQSTLMGEKLNPTTSKWKHTSTAAGLAEQLLFTTAFSGTHSGFYLGRVDHNTGKWDSLQAAIKSSRNIALYNPTIANKEGITGKITKNPHIKITGETGSGKSVLAQTIFLQASLTDTKILYMDPKQELREHYLKCCADPEFQARNPKLVKHLQGFNYVTLDASDPSNHGVLDPIVILEPIDAIETAKNIIDFLGEGKWEMAQKTAISKAVKAVVAKRSAGEQVGFKHVIKCLMQSTDEKIKQAGEYLFETTEATILDLVFSDGHVRSLSYDERVTILEVANMTLPKEKKVKMSEHERNSVALMFALGKFCMKFGQMNRFEDTMIFFDESWILEETTEGRLVIKSMKRVGRSQNNILVLITQSANDNGKEDDTTSFGTIFAFDEPSERAAILRQMQLEVTPENLAWIENMNSGQCLFKDVFGNLNRLSIHVHLPEWLELFTPLEATTASHIENKYARTG